MEIWELNQLIEHNTGIGFVEDDALVLNGTMPTCHYVWCAEHNYGDFPCPLRAAISGIACLLGWYGGKFSL